jgi:hypothetical protein
MKICVILIALLLSACKPGEMCELKQSDYKSAERCFSDSSCKRNHNDYEWQQYRKDYIEKYCK